MSRGWQARNGDAVVGSSDGTHYTLHTTNDYRREGVCKQSGLQK
jgi:hypothetical protein